MSPRHRRQPSFLYGRLLLAVILVLIIVAEVKHA